MVEQELIGAKKVSDTFSKKPLTAKVEFDFPEITHPKFGTRRVKGQFPRILPRYRRPGPTTPEQMEYMISYIANWINKFAEGKLEAKYFQGLEHTLGVFVPALYPFPAIETTRNEIALKAIYWFWIVDNVFEEAILTIPIDVLEKAVAGLLRLFRNPDEVFEDVPEFPYYSFLFHTFQDVHKCFSAYSPTYKNKMVLFDFPIDRYFNAMLRYAVTPIDAKCTEDSFRNYRMILEYFDLVVFTAWILESEESDLPERIRNCGSMRRILDLVNSIGGLTNDLLGMKKDFEKNEYDNLVLFKVLQKGIPLEKAVEQMCQLIFDAIDNFLILRDSLLETFDFHPQLVKYVDICEAVIDGNNIFFVGSIRHKSVGAVKLVE